MTDRWVKLLATFFYIGDIPIAPGSVASVAGVFIYILLSENPVLYVLTFIIVTILGFAVSGRTEEIVKQKDPSCIVIDEVAGMMLALYLLPMNTAVIVTTFFLFRAFDMFKLYPVNKFESMDGSTGVMMDDIFAGLYTNITMQIAVRWAGIV